MTRVAEFFLGQRQVRVLMLSANGAALEPAVGQELARFTLEGAEYSVAADASLSREPSAPSPAEVLTSRELQIAALIARGYLNKQAADQLKISEWTVCAHLRRIYAKLQVTSRAAMVYRCAALVDALQAPGRVGRSA